MRKLFNTIWLILFLVFATILACTVDRECYICPNSIPCAPKVPENDTLFLSDFELGENPTEHGGGLTFWKDTLSNIKVQIFYDSTKGGARGSKYYAKLEISGNDGMSMKEWSGGGLVLEFTDCVKGIDISGYDSLQFDVKTFPGSNLGQTKIKLEDVSKDSIPERYLIEFNKDFPSEDWITISIPLSTFGLVKPADSLHQWVALDEKRVRRLVTTTINEPSTGGIMDGILGLDNVRLVRR